MGAGRLAARLTREAIDVARLIAEAGRDCDGAISSFLGIVRLEKNDAGQALRALEYSAHEQMALTEIERIIDAAAGKGDVSSIVVEHRLGVIAIGDASIAIVVAAPHRSAALRVCAEVIERVKELVPIFKREIWEGGGQSWVNPV